MVRVATWNVNSLKIRLEQVMEWLNTYQPDILALQEIKMPDEAFPHAVFVELGYQACVSGQKAFNGVALLSKISANNIVKIFPNDDDPQKRLLAATYGPLRVINIYLPNGQRLDSEKFVYKRNWIGRLQEMLYLELNQHPYVVLCGDFNIAPAAEDVHEPARWEDTVLFCEEMRQHFQTFLNLGMVDAFRLQKQEPNLFSWWDYRAGAYWKNNGLRIDHVLVSKPLAERCQQVVIDSRPRRLKRPSDHAPVFADILFRE